MEITAVSSRRDFLRAAGLGAAAAAIVAGTQGQGDDARTEVAGKAVDGYRASSHVVKYYRTAEF
jgi:hypothetical protein